MPYYQFRCDKCDHAFEESIYLDGKDPPDYYKCPNCKNKKAPREYFTPDRMPGADVKGVTDRARRRDRNIRENGMDKSMAENFYKESCEASKQRMATGYEHYKQVLPDVKQHIKQGIARVNNDQQKKETIDAWKKVGGKVQEIRDKITKVKKPQ